jgi:4-amino-4-deoxy-L-arabinose transferase-like glycosyltransferase
MTPRLRNPENTDAVTPPLLSEWRWWLTPALLSLALSFIFRDPFAGDWDSLDYTVLAVNGWEPSSMLLGRMLFIFGNRVAYLLAHSIFGLPADKAYLLFKYMVIAQVPLATTALWAFARELSGSIRTATVAALMLALSPYYVAYGGQAMTEIPSILLLCVALTLHLRGLKRRSTWRVLLGAALLGLGVNLREGVGLFGLWLAFSPFTIGWKWRMRDLLITAAACAVFFLTALGPFGLWYGLDVGGYQAKWWTWVDSSKMESALHPVTLANFHPLLRWFFLAAPLALVLWPFAFFKEWRDRGVTPLLLIGAIGLFANLSLIGHYSTVINGRYLLTGLPGLLPLIADFLVRVLDPTRLDGFFRNRRAEIRESLSGGFVPAVVVVLAVGLWVGWRVYPEAWPTIQYHGTWKEYRSRLEKIPSENSVVIAGGQTVAVSFWRGVGAGKWEIIGTGGGWPGDERIVEVINEHLNRGRRVFLDADPRQWSPTGWQISETRAIAGLENAFRFRRISDTIYELRPPSDETANDDPNLEALLPENRKPQ